MLQYSYQGDNMDEKSMKINKMLSKIGLTDITVSRNDDFNKGLPLLIKSAYEFYTVSLNQLEEQFIIMDPLSEVKDIEMLFDHFNYVLKKTDMQVTIFVNSIDLKIKRTFIKYKCPFITEKEIYLPFLAINLKRTHQKRMIRYTESFTPSTQVVFLAILYLWDKQSENLNPTKISEYTSFSRMTVYRAFETFVNMGIFEEVSGNKYNMWKIDKTKEQLWEVAKNSLIDPINRIVKVRPQLIEELMKTSKIYISSYNALSTMSNLVSDSKRTYAISLREFNKNVKANKLENYLEYDYIGVFDDTVELELWNYDVLDVCEDDKHENVVDPLSLYLTLRTDDDPRVETELELLLERILKSNE